MLTCFRREKLRKLNTSESVGALQTTVLNSLSVAPVDRQEVDAAEAEGLYAAALAAKKRHSRPLDLYDLMMTLKKDRAVIPSHTVYSLNMERIQMKLHHST